MPRPLIPDRQRRILDAAEGLVLERGFDAMSIQSIADRVGIAKGAVYREFESKNAIVDAILRRGNERMTRASTLMLDGDENPPPSKAYAVGAEVLLEDKLMTAAFLDDRSVLGSYLDTVTDDRYRRRHESVVAWIRMLQERGTLSADLDTEGLALVLSSTTLGLLHAARHIGPLTAKELRTAIETMGALIAAHESAG